MRTISKGRVPLQIGRNAFRPRSLQQTHFHGTDAFIRRPYSYSSTKPSERLAALEISSRLTPTSSAPTQNLIYLRSLRSPQLLRLPLSLHQRSYSQSFRQSSGQAKSPNARPGEGDSTAKADGEAKDSADTTSSAEPGPENSGNKSEGEGEAGKDGDASKDSKDGAKKETPPPPPPHGDKTPWQVFTETLNTEFKASKEWNESTKALQSGVNDFTQNPNVVRARSAYSQSKDAATTVTSAAFKNTGKVLGHGAAWTWDTSVVKVVRKGVNATGRGIEKATRPVRETEAFKSVKTTIDDGSSSRYGGWTEKEERKRRRELRELNELNRVGGKRLEKLEEDPEAGTNVTLHKDAAWKESWRDFRDQSRLMQGFFNVKTAYNESENPFISTARSISDRFAGFFAENETAQVIKKFREIDPNFKMEPFLTEMREYILPEVLDAYVKGDIETLKLWLSAAQYQVYAALMQQYTTAGLKSDGRILDIRNVDVLSARMLDPGEIPVFIITCRTQEVHVYRNAKTNDLAAGMDDRVQQVTYVIGVTRIPEDVSNPETRGWRMIELHKSARDYL